MAEEQEMKEYQVTGNWTVRYNGEKHRPMDVFSAVPKEVTGLVAEGRISLFVAPEPGKDEPSPYDGMSKAELFQAAEAKGLAHLIPKNPTAKQLIKLLTKGEEAGE